MENSKESNRNATEFMLAEFSHMYSTWYNHASHQIEWLKFYFLLMSLPITLIVAAFEITGIKLSLFELPTFVSLIMFILSICAFIITYIVVNLRFEILYYIKYINLIRKYFNDLYKDEELEKTYFGLPITDDFPKFLESPSYRQRHSKNKQLRVSVTFFAVLLMGIINSVYFIISVKNLVPRFLLMSNNSVGHIINVGLWGSFVMLHVFVYRFVAKRKDDNWPVKYPDKT